MYKLVLPDWNENQGQTFWSVRCFVYFKRDFTWCMDCKFPICQNKFSKTNNFWTTHKIVTYHYGTYNNERYEHDYAYC